MVDSVRRTERGTSMSGFGEVYGEFGHTHLSWPHTVNTTPGGISSDQSCPPSLSRKKNIEFEVSWKALFPFLMLNLQSFPKYWYILKISLSSPIPFLQFVLLSQMQFVQKKEISTYGKFSDGVAAPFSFSLGVFSTPCCETQKSYLGRHLSEPKNHSFLSVCPWFWENVLRGSSTMFY